MKADHKRTERYRTYINVVTLSDLTTTNAQYIFEHQVEIDRNQFQNMISTVNFIRPIPIIWTYLVRILLSFGSCHLAIFFHYFPADIRPMNHHWKNPNINFYSYFSRPHTVIASSDFSSFFSKFVYICLFLPQRTINYSCSHSEVSNEKKNPCVIKIYFWEFPIRLLVSSFKWLRWLWEFRIGK